MGSPLPPDPYLALGLPKDASAAQIKTTYRKLILRFHPDKVQDAAQKQIAADEFHKVQTAYEIIGDEDRRARYDAQVKLVGLRKEMMEKQSAGAGAQSEVRSSGYSRMRTESPVRANYTARGADRSERVHVEERRPYDAEYFDRPRTTSRKDYDYERPTSSKRSTPKTEKERTRSSRQSAKENERVKQKERTKQSTRDTRKDRDYKYSYAGPETASSSDSDAPVGPARYSRREEDERRRDRDSYFEQPRRLKEDMPRNLHVEERARKMQSDESNAREYIERSRGGSRQYAEPVRRPSPQRPSPKDKVEYIKRGEGRPPVMVRRGSGKPRPAEREPDESPRRESPRRERERTRRSSHDHGELPRKAAPPLNHTKSAPGEIHIPDQPRRSYTMQPEPEESDEFQPPPFRRTESMPQPSPRRERERDSSRKVQKPSGLRRTETTDGLPTPGATPEPGHPNTSKSPFGREYADDFEYPTPNGYRTEVHEPAATGRGKVTRSPSPINTKEDRGRTPSSRQRPTMPSSRTTSYVYTPQGLQDMPQRPSLSRNESLRREHLYSEIPTTRTSPRQSRSKYSPPGEDVRYQQYRPEDVKYQTGYSSRRASEMRPSYNRTNSYTSQAAY